MENTETLKQWLEYQYLKWQQENGRISVRKWSKILGVNYSYLNNLITGDNPSTSMQTAYQIGERLNDFSILEVLGYPVPDAPLVDLPDEERSAILDWLESVKRMLDDVPEHERMAKLKTILDAMPDAETDES